MSEYKRFEFIVLEFWLFPNLQIKVKVKTTHDQGRLTKFFICY